MPALENKLKVTLTSTNAPLLIAAGSLIPGVGGTVEKLLKAVASSNGLATTGKGSIAGGRLRFLGDNFASWILGQRLILDIPLREVTAVHRGSHYLGGYYFTLVHLKNPIDMCALYGGGPFLDRLILEVEAHGGST